METLKPVTRQTLGQQVATQLASMVTSGKWRTGERLPPEMELCKILHIGRSTLREALKSLAFVGLVQMRHGEGTFVAQGTDHLLAAAEATGVSHVVAQSFGAFGGIREGGWVKTEEDPMDPGPASARQGTEALRHLEDVVVKAGGAALRYGSFYGPGASEVMLDILRKRQPHLVSSFPDHLQRATIPVDVLKTQLRHISRAQS